MNSTKSVPNTRLINLFDVPKLSALQARLFDTPQPTMHPVNQLAIRAGRKAVSE